MKDVMWIERFCDYSWELFINDVQNLLENEILGCITISLKSFKVTEVKQHA